ncbi:sulfatase [bacterium]|nr:sulfatase [bacterium]
MTRKENGDLTPGSVQQLTEVMPSAIRTTHHLRSLSSGPTNTDACHGPERHLVEKKLTRMPLISLAPLCRTFILSVLVVHLADDGSKLLNAGNQEQPNIIFILADDLGWSELGCYGNTFNETPHINQLAAKGMRFTNAYAAAPVCSPYRAAFLTGQHPARLGIHDYLRPNSANSLSPILSSIPKVLAKNGYRTGVIGKWHLTGYEYHGAEFEIQPRQHGFQWTFGNEVKSVGNGANFWPYRFRDQPIPWINITEPRLGPNEYLTDRLNKEAVDFVLRNQEQPFFLFLSHYAPHTILNGRPDLVEKYRKKHPPGESSRHRCYLCEDAGVLKAGTHNHGDPLNHWAHSHNPHLAAMLESIDDGVGKLMQAVDSLNRQRQTLIIFSSDNGGETNVTSNHPLRGGKSQLYEGGIRVPLIASWPGTIPEATTNAQITQNVDFFPTLLDATEADETQTTFIDGVSILESLKNPDVAPERSFIAWHYPLDEPHFLGGTSSAAIRQGKWKLIESFVDGSAELYDLSIDVSEQNDVSKSKPQIAKRLSDLLVKWRRTTQARTPSPPILVQPQELKFAEHFNLDQFSERIWYNADWIPEDGILQRRASGQENTRVFLRDAAFKNAMIRFDFRLGEANDIRLMTGNGGHYNTVLHVRPDHFFLQTAQDKSAPYFSYRHGECAFKFERDRWYSVTVEFAEDQCVAHLDREHLVTARHPIIDQQRDYLAIQVDQGNTSFDNFQLFAAKRRDLKTQKFEQLEKRVGKYPVEKTLDEKLKIEWNNSHARFHLHDQKYRDLVQDVNSLDLELRQKYPDVFVTHKELKLQFAENRKNRLKTDPVYQLMIAESKQAKTTVDKWLMDKNPKLKTVPSNRKKSLFAETRSRLRTDPELLLLIQASNEIEQRIRAQYADDYPSDKEIDQKKKVAREMHRNELQFKELSKKRSEAYQKQRAFLLENNPVLQGLHTQL